MQQYGVDAFAHPSPDGGTVTVRFRGDASNSRLPLPSDQNSDDPFYWSGSAPNANNFEQTDASGFPVGNAITTPHSLLLGFGLEGVSTQAERNAVIGRALDHLLG